MERKIVELVKKNESDITRSLVTSSLLISLGYGLLATGNVAGLIPAAAGVTLQALSIGDSAHNNELISTVSDRIPEVLRVNSAYVEQRRPITRGNLLSALVVVGGALAASPATIALGALGFATVGIAGMLMPNPVIPQAETPIEQPKAAPSVCTWGPVTTTPVSQMNTLDDVLAAYSSEG
jgi:hypothetical protein